VQEDLRVTMWTEAVALCAHEPVDILNVIIFCGMVTIAEQRLSYLRDGRKYLC